MGRRGSGAQGAEHRVALAKQQMQAGRYHDAIALCGVLLSDDPDCADALRIGGAAALLTQHYEQAVPLLRRALERCPDDPALLNNLGMALERSGHPADAVAILRGAAARHPGRRDILLNLATALQQCYELDGAAGICESLLRRNARDAHALCNLGRIHQDAGRVEQAVSCYQRAIVADPHLREAREYLALALLLAGDFTRGWHAFESRRFHDLSRLSERVPQWNGELSTGRSLTVVTEQGFGDAIQFVRYGALLKRAGLSACLQCDPAAALPMSSHTAPAQ